MGYKRVTIIMKKMNLLAVVLLMVTALTACAAKKQVAQQQSVSQQPTYNTPAPTTPQEDPEVAALKKQIEMQKLQNELKAVQAAGAHVDIPCAEFQDDKDYFRDFGVGTSQNLQSARKDAIMAAKSMIRQKLAEFVQGFSTDYANSYAGKAAGDDVQRKMESDMMAVVEGMLNEAGKVCEERRINERGTNDYYYAIEIPKRELKKNMIDALSADEKLDIDTREAMFEQKMDEYMEKMLEAKKKAGY